VNLYRSENLKSCISKEHEVHTKFNENPSVGTKIIGGRLLSTNPPDLTVE
jgi:hypothetical protein